MLPSNNIRGSSVVEHPAHTWEVSGSNPLPKNKIGSSITLNILKAQAMTMLPSNIFALKTLGLSITSVFD